MYEEVMKKRQTRGCAVFFDGTNRRTLHLKARILCLSAALVICPATRWDTNGRVIKKIKLAAGILVQ
jgi:hypothetical protein